MSKKSNPKADEHDIKEDLADFEELPEDSKEMMALKEENKKRFFVITCGGFLKLLG